MSNSTLVHDTEVVSLPGYDYGRPGTAASPVSLEELRQIEATVGWSDEDARILQRHGEVFRKNAAQMVDTWRAIIAGQPHLAQVFLRPDGQPDEEYKAKVKQRFVQWVIDACFRPHDQAWLNYQEEIGRRHTPEEKNQTDHAQGSPLVPLRSLIGFVPAVANSTRKFFIEAQVEGEELQRLSDAWLKAVQLHVVLWSRPYVKEGWW
jgi:Protoglobin